MGTRAARHEIAGFAAMAVMACAACLAAGFIWLLTTNPGSLAMPATAEGVWRLLAGVADRLIAII